MSNYVPGTGNPLAKLMILGEAPGRTEDLKSTPFIGASGELLDRIFTDMGHQDWRTKWWVSNVFKYRPPENNLKRIQEVCNPEEQLVNLHKEIADINPNCILALGKTALQHTTGQSKIGDWRGSVIPYIDSSRKVVGTIHPANLVRATNDSGDSSEAFKTFPYIYKQIVISDIKKAIEESKSPTYRAPSRSLQVCNSYIQLYRYLKANKGRIPFVDIETWSCTLPSCVSLAFDEWEAISIPMFPSLGKTELTSMNSDELANIWMALNELWSTTLISGQNLKFDIPKLEMLGFSFKGVRSDISIKAHTVNPEIPRLNQGFLASIYSKQPYYKDDGKEFIYGKHPIKNLYIYNAMDSAVACEIDRNLEEELYILSDMYHVNLYSYYYDYRVKLHYFYKDMEEVGFKIDENLRNYLRCKYESWSENLGLRLKARIGDVNTGSWQQVEELMYERMGIKPLRNVDSKTSEDTIAKLLKDEVRDDYRTEILSDILEKRRVDKTLSTYIYARQDFDGRLRTQYRICGTETGRSSTSILKEPVRPYASGIAFQTLTKYGGIGDDIRGMLIPDEGFTFVNIDLSQAEARVVALLSEDYEFLEAMDKVDVHRRMAACALFTGKLNLKPGHDPYDDIITKDSPERFIGKKSKHATNYDMKWMEFQKNVISDCRHFNIDFTISPFKAKQILERIHAATPKVRDVYHTQIQNCIDTTRLLVRPFGSIRRFFERPGDKLYKEAYADIPQNTVKEVLTRAGLSVKENKYPIKLCGESHDALLYMMPTNEYVDICKAIKPLIETPIDFTGCSLPRAMKLVIPASFEHGSNYKELEGFKV